jgi:hypothetical protein
MATVKQSSNFQTRLGRLLTRVRLRAVRYGLVRTMTVGGGALLLAAWAVGAESGPGGFIAWGLSLSLLAVLVLAVRHLLFQSLRPWRRARDLVANIEQQDKFSNVLVSAEEAERLPERWDTSHPVRAELLRRLYQRADAILEDLNPGQVLVLPYARAWGLGLVAVFCLGILMMVTGPEDLSRGIGRLAKPIPVKVLVPVGGLYGLADRDFVIAGLDIELAALDFAGGSGPAVCEIRIGSGMWQRMDTRGERVFVAEPGLPSPYRKWASVVPEVREDFDWRFRRGEMVTDIGQVKVRHHPLVTGLSALVTPPAYTRLPARRMARLPAWFEVPAGSSVRLSGTVNHSVDQAMIVTTAGDTLWLEEDSLGISGTLRVAEATIFTIHLEDAFGLRNLSPLQYEVAAALDVAPAVRLERVDDNGILPISGEVTLEVEAADDFGLAGLDLRIRVEARGSRGPASVDSGDWQSGRFWPRAGDGWLTINTSAGQLRVRPADQGKSLSELRVRLRLEIQAGDMDLVAGDALEFSVEAVDNKRPGPPGRTRSRVVRLVLPSAADVLTSQAETSQERRSELEEMRRRSRELDADLDRLTRELMKNPLPDWARQQEMEAAIERQKTLQEELARVARELQEELEQLAGSQLTSEEQQNKADEVSELLSQSGSERLNQLLDKMEEASGQVSPDEVARAMQEVARNQKEMARRLDAALAMLKRMAQEQELEGLASLLEKMIQKQQELADLSRQLEKEQAAAEAAGEEGKEGQEGEEGGENSEGQKSEEGQEGESGESDSQSKEGETPSAEELARRQEALAEELAQLTEKLEKALEEIREENAQNPESKSQDQMQAALEEALEKLEQQQSESKMSDASEQLMQMDPGEAAKMQEQALRDLGALYHVMIQSQEAMQMAMKMEQVSSLRGLAADLLAMSTRQEEIAAMIPPDLRDLRSLELTRSQHRVQKAAVRVRDNLSELMDEAPNRIMKLLKKLDDLIEEMGHSLRAMEENRAQIARRHARESLASSNRLVISLLTEAQMAGGSGGAGGSPMSSMSDQLKQMAKEQAGLNGSTEELRRMLANRGMSQELRSQMKRLGEQQAGLAGRMAELSEEERQQERQEGERVLGDLGQLGLDMESLSQDLDDGLVSEETLIRQERILSRMLDARNSVRRRDYSSRRESRTATRLFDEQEGSDGSGADDGENPFRLRYQPLEKAPLEYRDLVRRYFTALDSLRRLDDAPLPSEGRDMP